MPTKPAPIYRFLFRDALRLTWERKSLWVFGLFAAILSTGGVFELSWRAFGRVETGADVLTNLANGSFFGYQDFSVWLRQMEAVGAWRLPVMVAVLVVLAVVAVGLSIVSEGALVSAVREDQELAPQESLRRGRGHAWDVFVLNLVVKLTLSVVMLATTLPLVLIRTSTFGGETLLSAVVLAVFLPCVIAIQTIFMFALIGIVREQEHAVTAIRMAAETFWTHLVSCLEFGLAQFLLVFGAFFATIIAFLILLIPFSILLLLSLLTGLPLLFVLTYFIGSVVAFALFFVAVGSTTVFQYAGWWLFYERAMHRPGRTKLRPKLVRLWAKR